MADYLDGAVEPAVLDAADYNTAPWPSSRRRSALAVAAPVASARHPH
jgi:hypothetical protein